MKAIPFKEQNITYEGDEKHKDVPAFKADTKEGEVITCWKMSIKEKIIFLLTGKLWVTIISYNKHINPMHFSVKKSDAITNK